MDDFEDIPTPQTEEDVKTAKLLLGLQDEDLSDWENGFVESLLREAGKRGGKYFLSSRQKEQLWRLEEKYDV